MNIVKNIIKFGIILLLSYFVGLIIVEPLNISAKVGILLLPLIIMILLLNHMWGFMILLFIRPLITSFREYGFGGGLTLIGVFSLLNIGFAIFVLTRSLNAVLFHENIRWFYIYVFIALLSLINSTDISLSVVGLMKLLSLLALFLLGYNIPKSLEECLKIIRAILISAVIPLSYGMYQVITHHGAVYGRRLIDLVRVDSTLGIAHGFAYYSGVIILLSILGLFYSRGQKDNIFNFLIIIAAAVCILFTYTRAIWISILLTLCYISIYERKVRRWFILSCIVIASFFYHEVLKRFDDLINPPPAQHGINSLVFRIETAKQLLSNAVVKRPFLGFGIGVSGDVAFGSRYTDFTNLPHNDYIRVLVETGISGLIAYLAFLGKMFFYLLSLIRKKVNFHVNTILLGVLIYYLIASMSQNIFTYITPSGYVFALMGLAQKINDISEISKGDEKKGL